MPTDLGHIDFCVREQKKMFELTMVR